MTLTYLRMWEIIEEKKHPIAFICSKADEMCKIHCNHFTAQQVFAHMCMRTLGCEQETAATNYHPLVKCGQTEESPGMIKTIHQATRGTVTQGHTCKNVMPI